jgi:hypothetical protein
MKIRACSTFPYLIKIVNDSCVIENEFKLTAEKLIKKNNTPIQLKIHIINI